jgi:hypothetical protein
MVHLVAGAGAMKRGLALDLGTTTGWAADNPDGSTVPFEGLWYCTHQGGDLGEAYVQFEGKLIGAIRRLDPDYIAYEAAIAPRWGKTNMAAQRKLLGLGAITDLVAKRLKLPCYDVNLMSARRHFTGNGRASKTDVWHQCKLNGWPARDMNSCDALCVLAYARACFGQVQILGKVL